MEILKNLFVSGNVHSAVEHGDFEKVVRLVEKNKALTGSCDEKGNTPLHLASKSLVDTQIIEFLIARGADIGARNMDGKTPLHFAVEAGSRAAIEILLAQGADINAPDSSGCTVLHYVTDEEIAHLLIEKGADLQVRNTFDASPLHVALSHSLYGIARFFIDSGVNVNSKDKIGWTPLHEVMRNAGTILEKNDKHEIAKLLISRGADINTADQNGMTPLHMTCDKNLPELARLFIAHRAKVNGMDHDGTTPLHMAAFRGAKEIVEMLLDCDAEASCVDNEGSTPLHELFREEHHSEDEAERVECAKLLIGRGAALYALDGKNATPLSVAISSKYQSSVEFLQSQAAPDNGV